MDQSQLEELGLSRTEAALYLALIKIGASDVQSLVEATGFYKSNVYDALERLCEKGIISKIIEGNKRVYQFQRPSALLEFVQKKKVELDRQEQLARDISREVHLTKKHSLSPETAIVMRGLAGVKQIYSEIVEKRLDYLAFGGPKESDLIIGSHYWQNLHVKQRRFHIKAKMIFHKSLRRWTNLVPKDLVDLRFFDESFEPLTETTIYGSKVAFVVWSEKPIVTIIDNAHVSNSYRQIFNLLWRSSKP